MSESSQVARSSTPKGTMSPRTSDFDDHDSSSIDIINGRDGIHGDCMIVERDDSVDDRGSHLMDDVDKKDIDAGKQQLCVLYTRDILLLWARAARDALYCDYCENYVTYAIHKSQCSSLSRNTCLYPYTDLKLYEVLVFPLLVEYLAICDLFSPFNR